VKPPQRYTPVEIPEDDYATDSTTDSDESITGDGYEDYSYDDDYETNVSDYESGAESDDGDDGDEPAQGVPK
jgi:hypothetical protein